MVETLAQPAQAALEGGRNVLDVLMERGFVENVSDEAGLREALADPINRPITMYIGFDPTASSLHIGNLLGIMLMAHVQRHGHRPIALVGGGTGMIGDPTDKSATRPILTLEQIGENIKGQRPQFARYLDFEGNRFGSNPPALLLNNADWLTPLRYIEFLRDIGKHFSVNQILSHSTYRDRLETGSLNFIEINYVLLQAYDFLHQFREFGCTLQAGGSDQWFNILAGTELVRKVEGGQAFALVTPLLTTASGEKMGKTATGERIWLDPEQTTPYQFFQYWVNVEDSMVEQLLKLYTFLPLDEIAALAKLEGAELRKAKEILAFEATKLSHGEEAARTAQAASRALFSGEGDLGEGVPTTTVARAELAAGIPLVDLLVTAGLAKSKSEARRLIGQNGAAVNGATVADVEARVTEADLRDGTLILRAGKKRFSRVVAGE
jgi:tyrosyl-tRNA synthetase